MALTVAMGIALTGCGKDVGGNTNAEKEATVSVEEKSKEMESIEVVVETESETSEDDYTYCNLLSDPYFDMDNAIKDENGTKVVQAVLPSAADKELLYNIVDGDKYVEISGAEAYDVNDTVTVSGGTKLFPNLAYYGIDPNPQCSGVPQYRFFCMDTTFQDIVTLDYELPGGMYEVTVIKAYTIPKDSENGLGLGFVISYSSGTPALCEVEYNGEHYWTTSISLEQALGELE